MQGHTDVNFPNSRINREEQTDGIRGKGAVEDVWYWDGGNNRVVKATA